MEGILGILFIVSIIYLAIWVIKALIRNATNMPTWEGIIISAILGMVPFYFILCFFGIMGEKRNRNININEQSETGTYAEEMSKRYSYENPTKKKKNWMNYAVLGFVLISLFYFFRTDNSDEQENDTLVETSISDKIAIEELQEETAPVSKNTSSIKKQKASNSEKDKPNVDVKTNEKMKSTLEILEERNHANVVEQAKEAGVSTEGSTLDILERINHANVVEQAKEAGVSTKGSTLDILERINHANVVEQAKEAGVSTKGSTLDILERINHASVIEQAKEMGVSTEGSTLDILERIQRKSLEELLE